MPNITVEHDVDRAERRIAHIAKQIPYATARAINDTTKDVQSTQQTHMLRVFNVRRTQWVKRNVKIVRWATKGKQEAEIGIVSPGGGDRSDVLATFERQRQKLPEGRHLAVPVGPQKLTRRTQAFPNIRARFGPFVRVGKSLHGKDRTFVLPGIGLAQRMGGGEGTRWQRAGRSGASVGRTYRKKSRVRLLYVFVTRVRIQPVLNFVKNARRVVQRTYDRHFHKRFQEAMRTAK